MLSALAQGGPGSSCPQAGLCPPGFGAVAGVHSPGQHSPASRAAPALLFHTHGRGLEAVGLSPVVVPGAALAASSPLQARSSSLPPVSSLVLNRPVPACLFATSWHPAAPSCPAPVRPLLSVGGCGTAWVPCAHDPDAAAVGSEPTGSSEGSSTAIACFAQARDRALPSPSSADPRALAGLCTCQSSTQESQGRPGSLPHWDRSWLSGAGSRKGTLDGSQYSSLGQHHLPAPTSTRARLLHKLAGCCGSGTGCVWCPWVQEEGSGCRHRVLPPPGPALPSSSPDKASLPLLPEVPPHSPLLHAAALGKWVQPGSPTLPSPSPSGCSHGNIPDQSPLLSQSCTNPCQLQHCSLRALKGLGHQDHAGRGRRQARAGSLLQEDTSGCRKREWPCFCPSAAPCHCHPCLLRQASKSPRAPPGSNNTGQAGKPSSQAPALQPCSCPAAMPTASTR